MNRKAPIGGVCLLAALGLVVFFLHVLRRRRPRRKLRDRRLPGPRKALEAKTGHVFGARWRTSEPIGGTYAQDVPGAAQGNWFVPGLSFRTSTDPSPFLGLAHDYVDPTQPMIE